MNRIDLTRNGGLKFTQTALDKMQQSYLAGFGAIAALLGDNVIVSGCVVSGGTVTNGWVVINGELLPFEGGSLLTYVAVEETIETRAYNDGAEKDFYYQRLAKCSVAGGVSFASLQRPAFVPAGCIMMWSGAVVGVPSGWALCDGAGGTPDLRGRFVVGYDGADADYNTIGNTGGEKVHALTIDELPSHTHSMVNSNSSSGYGKAATGADAQEGPNLVTNPTGGGAAHENRPPYYTLAYIIKL